MLSFKTIAEQQATTNKIQPKLKIGKPGDKYEKAADAVADKVMMMSENNTLQMQPEEEEEEMLQMKPMEGVHNQIQMKCTNCEKEEMAQLKSADGVNFTTPNLTSNIQTSRGNGRPLSSSTNRFMSKAIGADFSQVKIHTDSKANQMNRQLGARAFTYGNDIFFNRGEFNPESRRGRHLLAHELTHTLQQRNSIGRMIQKYSHEDCDETLDLRPHIWPANHSAISMVDRAIAALTASPISAATNALLDKHFNSHSASTASSVLAVFRDIKTAFDGDDYTYECEYDCDRNTAAYVYGVWSDVHLCMNELRGKPNRDIAGIIVHEFSHYYGGTDDEQYYFFYGHGGAPSSLSTSDAINNADSYGGFAYDS